VTTNPLQLVIVGAGSVGLALGARLGAAGHAVHFVVRQPEQAAAIDRDGVRVEDVQTGAAVSTAASAGVGFDEADREPSFILICTRTSSTEEVAREASRRFPDAVAASVQNHVCNETIIARYFPRVIGAVWRQTCTRIASNVARAGGVARAIVGAHPDGHRPDVALLAGAFASGGIDVSQSDRISEDKWLKLCVNLSSIPNALVRPCDHTTLAFVEGKARLLEEAREVLRAAGIVAKSCDGRDRSLHAEIEYHRSSLALGTSARRLPLYNQVWRAFRERADGTVTGNSLEANEYHQLVIELGTRHGVPTPLNEHVLSATMRAWRGRSSPECFSAAELFGSAPNS
jgi:2-dehydropantoate 2-reductase